MEGSLEEVACCDCRGHLTPLPERGKRYKELAKRKSWELER
jgi:hypothetical protein